MTEKEKLLAGLPYDCGDAELLAQWHRAKNLTRDLFLLDSEDEAGKAALLDTLLGGHGPQLWVTPPFHVDYGWNIFLGNHCEINQNCVFQDAAPITLGDHALIGPNVQIYTATHPLQAAQRLAGQITSDEHFAFSLTTALPVTVGHHVWIGGSAILLPGVTVGNHATIGAGSVVTHDIPDGTVAYGNPCRVHRKTETEG